MSNMKSVKGHGNGHGKNPKKEKTQPKLMIDGLLKYGELSEDKLFFKYGIKSADSAKSKANKILRPEGKVIKQRRVMINTNLFNPNRKSIRFYRIEDIKKK